MDKIIKHDFKDCTNNRGRDPQMIKVPGAYTFLRWFSTTRNTPWGKEASHVASAFLGKYASITAVDLIQWKKLNFRNLI